MTLLIYQTWTKIACSLEEIETSCTSAAVPSSGVLRALRMRLCHGAIVGQKISKYCDNIVNPNPILSLSMQVSRPNAEANAGGSRVVAMLRIV
jgi:hypothetical protein